MGFEHLGWLVLLLVLPYLFVSERPWAVATAAFLLLWLTYLLYVSLAAPRRVVIDLGLEEVRVYPGSRLLLRLGLYRQRKWCFQHIAKTGLRDRALGKEQRLGKSLYLVSSKGEKVRLADFRSGGSAGKLERLFSELLQIKRHCNWQGQRSVEVL